MTETSVETETSLERFPQEAERCRAEAAQAAGETDRTAWLRMANDWARLAQEAVLANRRRIGTRPNPA